MRRVIAISTLLFTLALLGAATGGKPGKKEAPLRPSKLTAAELARCLPANWPVDLVDALRDKLSDADLAKELGLFAWAFDVARPAAPFQVWLDIEEGEVGEPALKRRFPQPGTPELIIAQPGRLVLSIGPRYSERMLAIVKEARGKADPALRHVIDLELWHQSADHLASFSKAIGTLWFDMKDKKLTIDTPTVAAITRDATALLRIEAIEKPADAKKAPWKVMVTLKAGLIKG